MSQINSSGGDITIRMLYDDMQLLKGLQKSRADVSAGTTFIEREWAKTGQKISSGLFGFSKLGALLSATAVIGGLTKAWKEFAENTDLAQDSFAAAGGTYKQIMMDIGATVDLIGRSVADSKALNGTFGVRGIIKDAQRMLLGDATVDVMDEDQAKSIEQKQQKAFDIQKDTLELEKARAAGNTVLAEQIAARVQFEAKEREISAMVTKGTITQSQGGELLRIAAEKRDAELATGTRQRTAEMKRLNDEERKRRIQEEETDRKEKERTDKGRQDAIDRIKADRESRDIQILTSEGRKTEAERRRIELDYARQIRDIQKDDYLTSEEKLQAVQALNTQKERELRLAKTVGTKESGNRSIPIGFATGSMLSSVFALPARPIETQQLSQLKQINKAVTRMSGGANQLARFA